MKPLLDGFRRFRADVWPEQRARYEALATRGQRPETLVIACSDSRVDPQTVFGSGPGELFVIRNLAALVPPYEPDTGYHGTSAALEFGVRVLKVSRIVVLAHAQCGGVQAMVKGAPPEARDFVARWMEIAEPVLWPIPEPRPPKDALLHLEAAIVGLSLKNLRSYPWITSAVRAGDLALHGFRFDIHNGELSRLEGDRLVPVS